MHKYLQLMFVVAMAGILTACPGEPVVTDGGTDAGSIQPAGTVAVNFSIDDTANKVFTAGQLEWKGGFKIDVDGGTRVISKDPNWGGPFPVLFDDGSWRAGGHEPSTATANDHKWGVTVFVKPPTTGEDTYEYGAIDNTTNGWIWRAPANGTFKVAAGATAEITAQGFALPPFGTVDVKIVVDTNALATRPQLADGGTGTWNTSKVAVKGSAWSWREATLVDDGTKGDDVASDGKYTFVLSNVVGTGKLAPHSGLLGSTDKAEFVFVFNDVEYKAASGAASSEGVTAFIKPATTFNSIAVTMSGNNTAVVIP
jgi:hypothetical protein